MKKILGAATAALVATCAMTLAGCSSGGSGSPSASPSAAPNPGSPQYCTDAGTAIAQLGGLGSGQAFTSSNFAALTTVVRTVVAEAPSDIKGSWTEIEDQFTFLKTTLDAAGVSIEDFGQIAQGQTPSGLDAAKLAALNASLKKYDITGLTTAHAKIQSEVRAVCNIVPTPTPT